MGDAMKNFPKQIGDYSIDCEIGRGGMGVVYKATDSRLGRSVAIKALPAGLADKPELNARFEREAKTLAALNHPTITMYWTMALVGTSKDVEIAVYNS